MISARLRFALAAFAAAGLAGCTWYNYDATHRAIASTIVGQCFELTQAAILSEHFSPFTGYWLDVAGANDCTPRAVGPGTRDEERYKFTGLMPPRCPWLPVANVPRGTKFRVTRITEQPYGDPGRCWKVEVTLLTGSNAGIKSGIPACLFDVPASTLWLRMQGRDAYVEPLEISERVARPCAQPAVTR